MSRTAKIVSASASIIGVLVIVIAAVIAYPWLVAYFKPPTVKARRHQSVLFRLVPGRPDTLEVSEEAVKAIGLETLEVVAAHAPDPLHLPGSLGLDPNRLVPVHSRFAGEVVLIGPVDPAFTSDDAEAGRRLRYGDRVKKSQLLAVVWSTDIGEKKSELVDAMSKLILDERVLQQYQKVGTGAIAGIAIYEAERNVEADKIAINKAIRTLRSWRLTDQEINDVRQEARQLHTHDPKTAAAKHWAELEIRAPMDGVIVEKNINAGTIVDTNDDLFKIADLSRIQVLASVYEEDLPYLERLKPAERHWLIDLKSDPFDNQIPGEFETIGVAIDPNMHTGAVIGWVDNKGHRLKIGQFVTATIQLPADPELVEVPASALIEEGTSSAVFVETDPARHEVTRRPVAVTRRGQRSIFIRSQPNERERGEGAQPLAIGEKVVMSGGLELNSELANLQAGGEDDDE
ncbi:MAG TPA: efflux RND transporter periplasmic adaptor subunit [Pirellulales bacterium]